MRGVHPVLLLLLLRELLQRVELPLSPVLLLLWVVPPATAVWRLLRGLLLVLLLVLMLLLLLL